MEEVLAELKKISKRLDVIEHRLVILENSGTKMSNHIDFIERIYESIKSPFHYVMDSIQLVRGHTLTE